MKQLTTYSDSVPQTPIKQVGGRLTISFEIVMYAVSIHHGYSIFFVSSCHTASIEEEMSIPFFIS